MTRDEIDMAWRRAAGEHEFSTLGILSDPILLATYKPRVFSSDEGFCERLNQRPVNRSRGLFRRGKKVIGDFGQKLFWACTDWIKRPDYFDCHLGQQRGKSLCIDGDGFRLLVGRHRLFLQVGDKQHCFPLTRNYRRESSYTPEQLAALSKYKTGAA